MAKSAMTRRRFVQASTLAGIAAAVGVSMSGSLVDAGKAYADEPVETKVVKTCCHGCILVCPCRAYVENGVVVKLEGDPDAPLSKGAMCTKGLNQLHTCYSPRRILHPMKRAGERGENKWEQISWDEALTLAVDKIYESMQKYGNYSLMTSTGGGGAYLFGETITMAWALKTPNSFEPGCAQCYIPRNSMAKYVYGGSDQSIADGAVLEPFNEWKPATKALVLWGTQPSASQTAEAGRAMCELRARGCKTVVIDPNLSADAAKADVWLPVRSGTDTALLMGWYRYILENTLYDKTFTKYWTNLPFLIDPDTKMPVEAQELFPDFKSTTPDNTPDYVCFDLNTNSVQPFPYTAPADATVDPEVIKTVEYEGKTYKTAGQIYWEACQEFTLEKTGEICHLDPQKIEEAIRIYADTEVAGISNGVFSDQSRIASEQTLGCLGLDCIMGYVNKPGATLTQNTAAPKVRANFNMCAPLSRKGIAGNVATIGYSYEQNLKAFNDFANKENQEMVWQLMKDRLGMDKHRGLYWNGMATIPAVHEAIDTGEPYRPRVWIDHSGNKLAALADAESWLSTAHSMDFVIGQYPMLTSFHVECCDLVFPTQEWLEYSGSDRMNQLNYTFMRCGVTHLGESVHPGDTIVQILSRLKAKDPTCVVPELCSATSEEAQKASQVKTFGAESWEDLVANQDKYVPLVKNPETFWVYNQHEAIVNDGLPAGFGTISRKCEPYCTLLLHMSRTGYPYSFPRELPPVKDGDYSPISHYVEAAEVPDEEYPFTITSGRLPYFHHSTMRHAAYARELCPTAECRINPEDAAKLGINHQDWIKITSRRNSIHARAVVAKYVQPGQLWMERFWNPECYDPSQKKMTSAGWREQNINCITKADGPFNEVYGSYTLRGFAVKIEKSTKPEGCWVEPEEFAPFLPTLQNEPVTEGVKFQ